MLAIACTSRMNMKVITLLTRRVVSTGLKRGWFRGRGSPPHRRCAHAMLSNMVDVAARARAAWRMCHADLEMATMSSGLCGTVADDTATPRTCPGMGLLRGSTSPTRGSWDTVYASTLATTMHELLAASVGPRCWPATLHQFGGGPRRLGATVGKPTAAAFLPRDGAPKFVGTDPSLGRAWRRAGTRRRTRPSPGAGLRNSGGRRPSRTQPRAAASPGILPASRRRPPSAQPLGSAMRTELRP